MPSHRASRQTGLIYIARCHDFYKIGYTKARPRERLSSLQVGNPYTLELIGTVPATEQDEQELHATYAEKRIRGEWFTLTQEEIEHILLPDRETATLPEPEPPSEPEPPPPGSAAEMAEKLRSLRPEELAILLEKISDLGIGPTS